MIFFSSFSWCQIDRVWVSKINSTIRNLDRNAVVEVGNGEIKILVQFTCELHSLIKSYNQVHGMVLVSLMTQIGYAGFLCWLQEDPIRFLYTQKLGQQRLDVDLILFDEDLDGEKHVLP